MVQNECVFGSHLFPVKRAVVVVGESGSENACARYVLRSIVLVNVPKDERPHASLQSRVVHRAPPSPQHDHAAGQYHTFVGPAPGIDLGVIIDLILVAQVVIGAGELVWHMWSIALGWRRLERSPGSARLWWHAVRLSQRVKVFHHRDPVPAWNVLLRRQGV